MTPFMRMLCVVVTITLAPTAVANADATDDDFVNTLAAQGITGEPSQLVAAGHTVCTSASGLGTTLPAGLTRMLPMGYVMSSLRLPANRAAFVVNTAISTYCPQLLGPQT
jgi:hypothetical protein